MTETPAEVTQLFRQLEPAIVHALDTNDAVMAHLIEGSSDIEMCSACWLPGYFVIPDVILLNPDIADELAGEWLWSLAVAGRRVVVLPWAGAACQ